MGVTMTKTRPGTELHTGALIRHALEERGVSIRIDRGWLIATAEPSGSPQVWVTAHDCNGGMHYDTHRGAFMGATAVVDYGDRAAPVFNGADLTTPAGPVGNVRAMADAVALFLGTITEPVPVDEWWK